MRAPTNRPSIPRAPTGGNVSRVEGRAGPRAADRRWLKRGLAAALGLVAGTTLFATQARGRAERPEEEREERRRSGR